MSVGLEIYRTEEKIGVHFLKWYWRLCAVKANFDLDPWHSYGVAYADRALHLRWGKHVKVVWMPFDFGANIRNEVQNESGAFVMASDAREGVARRALAKAGVDRSELFHLKIEDGRKWYKAPYTYTLKNGEIQTRMASFYVEEREWRWRIFHPFAIGPKKIQRSISVEFSDEVGEKTGSWKGGCTGCGYEMLPNETPLETLRRMECERKF